MTYRAHGCFQAGIKRWDLILLVVPLRAIIAEDPVICVVLAGHHESRF
jgi:hypothetical protein